MTGYQRTKATDPEEQALREAWHKAHETRGDEGGEMRFYWADRALADFLWNRATKIVQADRSRHPKARRNAPVGSYGPSGGRALP